MNHSHPPISRRHGIPLASLLAAGFLASTSQAHASHFQGETLDSIADVIAWVALIIAPIVGIAVFLMIHILPEKIAHKKGHPQTGAIQCLCLLSLVFGGLLWPIAWLWAYTKPIGYKLAYGTDRVEPHDQPESEKSGPSELEQLRARVAELEGQTSKTQPKGGKA